MLTPPIFFSLETMLLPPSHSMRTPASGSPALCTRVSDPCSDQGPGSPLRTPLPNPSWPRLEHLVNLLPAVLISDAQLGSVVQQQLAAAGVAPHHSRVEQRGQASAVLVVGGAPEVQECLRRETRQKTVPLVLAQPEGPAGQGDLGDPHWPRLLWVLPQCPCATLSLALPPMADVGRALEGAWRVSAAS